MFNKIDIEFWKTWNILDDCTRFSQKLFMSAREEQEEETAIESKEK